MPQRFVVIYRDSQGSLMAFLVITHDLGGVSTLHKISESTHDCELSQWMESPWAVTKWGKYTGCGLPVKRTRKPVG